MEARLPNWLRGLVCIREGAELEVSAPDGSREWFVGTLLVSAYWQVQTLACAMVGVKEVVADHEAGLAFWDRGTDFNLCKISDIGTLSFHSSGLEHSARWRGCSS